MPKQALIDALKRENEELTKKLENTTKEQTRLLEESDSVNKDQSVTKSEQSPANDIAPTQSSSLPENENTTIADSEVIRKLEKRFTETMERVAELTDEKQKLEHLVLQLQGETETIGELCITFFQHKKQK